MYINDRSAILLLIGAVLTTALITTHPIQAEIGKGKDIFKVITTIRMLFSNYVIYVD
jgi:hypothetical protein